MEGPPLGPGGEDITLPDQVAPRGRKASSTRKIKPQTSNCYAMPWCSLPLLPLVHVRVRCPGPCGACSPVCALCAVCVCRWCLHCRQRLGQLMHRCNSVVFSGVCRRCLGGSRAPGVRLARPDVHGYGSGRVWLGASLLLVLAGLAAVWAVGVGCGNVAPSAGLVIRQWLAVLGCGSRLIRVGALAALGACDGCGLEFGVFARSGAR